VKSGLIVDVYLPSGCRSLAYRLVYWCNRRVQQGHVTASKALTSCSQSRLPPSFHNSDHLPCVTPSDGMSEVDPSSPIMVADSPLTVPPSGTPTPEPLNRMPERNFWVELRHATAEERNYEDFYFNLRKIVAEHTEGSEEFYYVLLGDNKHHKVCTSGA